MLTLFRPPTIPPRDFPRSHLVPLDAALRENAIHVPLPSTGACEPLLLSTPAIDIRTAALTLRLSVSAGFCFLGEFPMVDFICRVPIDRRQHGVGEFRESNPYPGAFETFATLRRVVAFSTLSIIFRRCIVFGFDLVHTEDPHIQRLRLVARRWEKVNWLGPVKLHERRHMNTDGQERRPGLPRNDESPVFVSKELQIPRGSPF
jgi:hypothetical protein